MVARQVIFVLGMGRSGTSALARVLALAGGVLPEKLVAAHASNPAGHWEPLEAMNLNDEFLFRFGSTWFDPSFRLQDDGVIDRSAAEDFVARIRALLRSWPASGVLVVKEPRITVLASYWFEAAAAEGFEIKVVVPIRDPREVVASLATRDGISADLGALLWVKNNLMAERASRPFPRVFVSYTALLADWRRELGRIERALDMPFRPADDAAVDRFLDPALHREHAEDLPLPWSDATVPIRGLWEGLSRAADGAALDMAFFDAVLESHVARERVFRAAGDEYARGFMPHHVSGELETLRAHYDQGAGVIAQLQADLEAFVRAVEALRYEAEQLRAQLAISRDEVEAQQLQLHAAVTEIARVHESERLLTASAVAAHEEAERIRADLLESRAAQTRLLSEHAALREACETARREADRGSRALDEAVRQRSALQAQIDALLGSRSWRITLPLRRLMGTLQSRDGR